MPINPLIALGGQNVDTASPLVRMMEIQQVKKDNEYRDKQMGYLDKKLEAETATAEAAARKDREESVLVGAAALSNLLERGDTAGAEAFLLARQQTLVGEGKDPSDTLEAINLLQTNPEQLKSIARAGRETAIARGLIKDDGFTLGNTRYDSLGRKVASNETSFEPVTDESGRVVGQRDTKTGEVKDDPRRVIPRTTIGQAREDLANGLIQESDFKSIVAKESGLKSPAEINQLIAIERLKADINAQDPKRRLEIQKMEQDLAAGALKIQEGETQKAKAAGLKDNALRLVDDLLKDPDAVRSAVGPFDSSIVSPTAFPSTLRAQTKINQLKSILTAENLGIMTGVLSETDLKVIAAIAGGGLDITGDDEAFIEELGRLRKGFVAQGAKPQDAAPAETPAAPSIEVGATETLPNGITVTRKR